MHGWIRQGALMALALVGTFETAVLAQEAKEQPNLIQTSATAQEEVAPDSVSLALEVISQAATVEEARTDNATRMARLVAVIKGHGWKELTMQTARFSVAPVYEQQDKRLIQVLPKILGYKVSNSLIVKMEQLNKETLAERVTLVLDEGLQNGANQVSGPSFYVKDPEVVQERLLAEAVREAKRRAQIMAEAAGVKILRLHLLQDQWQEGFPLRKRGYADLQMARDAAVPTSIEVGEETISVTVVVAYEVESQP